MHDNLLYVLSRYADQWKERKSGEGSLVGGHREFNRTTISPSLTGGEFQVTFFVFFSGSTLYRRLIV